MLALGLLTCVGASADDSKVPAKEKAAPTEQDIPTYNLLEAMNKGLVGVEAEGKGDGRMTVSVTNQTKGQLRVVLPPGLIAQGAKVVSDGRSMAHCGSPPSASPPRRRSRSSGCRARGR